MEKCTTHQTQREWERIRRKKKKSYFSCFVKKSFFFLFLESFFILKIKKKKRTCFIWRIFLQLVHDCRFGKSRWKLHDKSKFQNSWFNNMYSYAFTNKQKVVLFKLLNCNNLIAGTEWKQNIPNRKKKEICVYTHTHPPLYLCFRCTYTWICLA